MFAMACVCVYRGVEFNHTAATMMMSVMTVVVIRTGKCEMQAPLLGLWSQCDAISQRLLAVGVVAGSFIQSVYL